VSTGAEILLAVVALTSVVVVLVGFVWAAVKDGQRDKALQKRLGTSRRTRLGR
jgi:predicted lysophospholipase L1 biosynthesis ABC-type transport system permease subunit